MTKNITLEQLDANKEIKAGAVVSYLSLLVDLVLALFYTPYLISILGESQFGIYSLAMSIVTFFVMDFGIGASVTRFLALYRSKGDFKSIENFLGITLKIYFIIDLVLFIILSISFAFINRIFIQLDSEEIGIFKAVFIVSSVFSLYSLFASPLNGILMAFERFYFLKITVLISRLTSVLLILFVIQYYPFVYIVVLINAFIGVLVSFVKLKYIKKRLISRINWRNKDLKLVKQIFGFSVFVILSIIFEQLTVNFGPIVLGIVAGGTTHIAFYAIGQTVYIFVVGIASAMNGLFLPKVSRLIESKTRTDILNLMIRVGRLQFYIMGLIILGIISMGNEFVSLWMGDGFNSVYMVILYLVIPYLIISSMDIAYMTIVAEGKMHLRVIGTGVSAILSLLIGSTGAIYFGAVGMAFGVAVGNIIGNIAVMIWVYHFHLKINMRLFFKECHMKLFGPWSSILVLSIALQSFFELESILFFVLKVIIITIFYILLMWFTAMNSFEKNLIIDSIKKFNNGFNTFISKIEK